MQNFKFSTDLYIFGASISLVPGTCTSIYLLARVTAWVQQYKKNMIAKSSFIMENLRP